MELTKILVIEDNEKNLEDAKNFFKKLGDYEVNYVKNYEDAQKILFENPDSVLNDRKFKGDIEGVISDIYFPLKNNSNKRKELTNSEYPIGILVATELDQLKIPFVLNTAGYHHGTKYEWINQLAGSKGWTIIDMNTDETIQNKESNSKDWEKAYIELERKMDD